MKRLLLIPLLATALSAQCVMCYRTAEGQNHARAMVLNKAILILGVPPFLILAGFVAYVFTSDKRHEKIAARAEAAALRSRDTR
jgi:hypothetical protein